MKMIAGKKYEDFWEFESDLDANPLPICFDPQEEQGKLNQRQYRLQRIWDDTPQSFDPPISKVK